ncbi:MAG: metal-dependent transcriptional regulator [Candidatus Promineifilaceae bacterium]|nr:metal-dependent transcriptional regulator [Candidatus Promineifilaceae bacterium]
MPRINNLPSGSSTQRNSLNHQAIEDYLKTIYMLAEEESPVSTSRIAAARAVAPASATSMIQRLARLNLVNYEKHFGVTLSDSGLQIALEVIRHHRLIELYLMKALGFSWDEVHEQADILEHVISEKLEERIAAVLNHPTHDPHGDPIPARDGSIVKRDLQPLASLASGATGRVARVVDDGNVRLLRQLSEAGLVPGVQFTVVRRADTGEPLTLELGGEQRRVAYDVAAVLLVEEGEKGS